MTERKAPTIKEFFAAPGDSEQNLNALDSPEGIEDLKRFASKLITLNHDLNNPLAGVVGYLELAMTSGDTLPPDTLEMLNNVQRSAELLQEVINRLTQAKRRLQASVDISQLEEGFE